jgi:protein-S-isoprenylcysteine O-methyltransferase Ste14
MTKRSLILRLMSILGFALTLTIWSWVLNRQFDHVQALIIIVGGVVAVFPVVWVGRRTLDAKPTIDQTAWVTSIVHFAIMVLLGAAIIEAARTAETWQGWVMPMPAEVGLALMMTTGTALLLTVVNLALQGLGAPFAIALTRRLATNWMYAWTRNPMVLSLLAFLVSLGIRLRSFLFVLWVLALVTPAMIVYLKAYEERELEIRFGASYLEYKAKTPMLWPRKPRGQ